VPLWHGLGFRKKKNMIINGGSAMENQNAGCSAQAVVLAFLSGAFAGALAGILLAPKSGEETRRELKGYARKTEEDIIEKAKEARAALDDTIERGKQYMAEKRADVEAAVKAGREAMKEKMDKCCT
jgi:gas vesicle protein